MLKTTIPTLLLAGAILLLAPACKAGGVRSEADASRTDAPKLLFSGDSALRNVERQVEFGPRVPGSGAHRFAAQWIENEFSRHGALVTPLETRLRTFDGVDIPVRNILASLDTSASRRLLIVAHWDTRPWADQDPDQAKRRIPVEGANDGASGVAVALELARALKSQRLPVGVDFLMVDAEDWGTEGNDESWAMGTRWFVNNPPEGWKLPEAVIVLDMVGDKNATFCREYFSTQAAPGLVAKVWDTAAKIGYGDFFPDTPGAPLTDDHVPFIEAGFPAIDIVDYRGGSQGGFPPQWHTSFDTPRLISPRTLEAVGRTVEAVAKDY